MTDVPVEQVAPPTGPSRQPGDFHAQPPRGTSLQPAAKVAREHPGHWVFCGTTDAKVEELRWRFIKEVQQGEKSTLGGNTEQWDAEVTRGVVRDAQPVTLDPAKGEQPLPGEKLTTLKWIAFLRVKTEVTRPDLGDF
jgi:hypothetical protein